MSSGNQTPRFRNFLISSHLSDIPRSTLPHPLDCLVNCLANRPGGNSRGDSPDCAADSLENRLDDYPADNLENDLPESLAGSLDHGIGNHPDDHSADSLQNRQ